MVQWFNGLKENKQTKTQINSKSTNKQISKSTIKKKSVSL
jgi:hypothetical protein